MPEPSVNHGPSRSKALRGTPTGGLLTRSSEEPRPSASSEASAQNQFLTVSNAKYLPNVVALHRSLDAACPAFTLRVVCMDDEAQRILMKMRLPSLVTYSVREVETYDPPLQDAKKGRTVAEYAWTLKASSLLFALDREPSLQMITWVGADILFFDDPAPMFEGLGEGSVLLTPHNFHPRWDKASGVGPYNADTVTFRRTEHGRKALEYWRDRCIEWCFFKHFNGLFADQRYLDDWPERFAGVRVSCHPGVGLTSANTPNYSLETSGSGARVDGHPLIFYHYTSHKLYWGVTTLRRLGLFRKDFQLTSRPVPIVWGTPPRIERVEEWHLWSLYMTRLSEAMAALRVVDPTFRAPFTGAERDGRRVLAARLLGPAGAMAKRATRVASRRGPKLVRRARRRAGGATRRARRRVIKGASRAARQLQGKRDS